MRILLINTVCGVTSTGKICTDLAQVYEENGHEVRIAYGRDDKGMPEKFKKYAIRIGKNIDVKLHGVKTRIFDDHGFGSKKATKLFLNWVDEYAPHIIHLHNLHGYFINLEILFDYLKKKEIPVVWTLHDCWSMTGHCTHFDLYGCEKWKNQCYKCGLRTRYPSSVLFDHSYKNYIRKKELFCDLKNMVIVTPSKWLKGIVEESFLNKYRIKIINNGIDTQLFSPTFSDLKRKYELEDKKIILGVASGWGEHKGLKYLLRLSEDLDKEYQIVIIGLLDEQLERIPSNIIGIKKTSNVKELAAWYTIASVFVNPTLEDNFPTTNLEALACGTPVITFNTGGSPESLTKECGIVVEKGNYKELLDAIYKVDEIDMNIVEVKDKAILGIEYLELYKEILDEEKNENNI